MEVNLNNIINIIISSCNSSWIWIFCVCSAFFGPAGRYISVGYLEGGESSVWFCFYPKASSLGMNTWYVIAENKEIFIQEFRSFISNISKM